MIPRQIPFLLWIRSSLVLISPLYLSRWTATLACSYLFIIPSLSSIRYGVPIFLTSYLQLFNCPNLKTTKFVSPHYIPLSLLTLSKLSEKILSTQNCAMCLNHSFSSVAQLCPTLRLYGLQHIRLPCPSPTPGACSNSRPSSQWCHPTISSSVVPFSCLQSFPASGYFPMSQFFRSGGQSIGASASVLPMNTQDWSPLG